MIDGHLRLKAARKLGIKEIPVILCDEWTPAQVKAFRLLVNRSATWAEWDDELLAIEMAELRDADYELNLTGFDANEIDACLLQEAPDEDVAPQVPAIPVTRPGDLWLCGSHRVLCGDRAMLKATGSGLSDSARLEGLGQGTAVWNGLGSKESIDGIGQPVRKRGLRRKPPGRRSPLLAILMLSVIGTSLW